MTPPLLHRLYAAGYSIVIIAQRLTAAEGRDVPVGEVCRRLKRAGLTRRMPAQWRSCWLPVFRKREA